MTLSTSAVAACCANDSWDPVLEFCNDLLGIVGNVIRQYEISKVWTLGVASISILIYQNITASARPEACLVSIHLKCLRGVKNGTRLVRSACPGSLSAADIVRRPSRVCFVAHNGLEVGHHAMSEKCATSGSRRRFINRAHRADLRPLVRRTSQSLR